MSYAHIKSDKLLLCHICAKSLRSQRCYDNHRLHRDVRIDRSQKCSQCGKWVVNMTSHLDQVHGALVACTLCGEMIRGRRRMTVHSAEKHGPAKEQPDLRCLHCDRQLPNTTKFRVSISRRLLLALLSGIFWQELFVIPGFFLWQEHMARHTGDDPFRCEFCPKTFKNNSCYYAHRMNAHPAEYGRLKGRALSGIRWQPKRRKMDVSDSVRLERDRARPYPYAPRGTAVACKVCGKLVKSVQTHMQQVHGKHTNVCSVCSKAFAYPYMLLDHMSVHTKDRVGHHACNYCAQRFHRYDAKFAHQKRAHHDEWLADKGKREARRRLENAAAVGADRNGMDG